MICLYESQLKCNSIHDFSTIFFFGPEKFTQFFCQAISVTFGRVVSWLAGWLTGWLLLCCTAWPVGWESIQNRCLVTGLLLLCCTATPLDLSTYQNWKVDKSLGFITFDIWDFTIFKKYTKTNGFLTMFALWNRKSSKHVRFYKVFWNIDFLHFQKRL